MSTLPPEILALVEMSPVEDLMLAVLRQGLPGIDVQTLIADDQTFPMVLVRTQADWGDWAGDPRFIDAATISIQAFCQGLNGDVDASLLSEAVRVVLRDSVNKPMPDLGHLIKVQMMGHPRRVTDWATSAGPVQYADLPTGVWRYESTYQIAMRKPRNKPFPTP